MSISIGTRDSGLGTGRRLIVGLGATGISVARHLARAGVSFAVTDSRDTPPNTAELAALGDIPCRFGAFASPLALSEIAEAVVSPGVSLDEPFLQELRAANIPIIGDIELFARALDRPVPSPGSRVPAQVIAITGSNGKSTVTAWVADVARAAGLNVAAGANFGTPALDLLADDVELYVLELSSFQLELTESMAPTAATVLNVSADHIDRHGSVARYADMKARILRNAGIALVNADDPRVAAMNSAGATRRSFGSAAGADYRLAVTDHGPALVRGGADRPWLAAGALALTGRHNQLNALAVWALAEAIGLGADIVRARLPRFTGLAHRCQLVADRAGVRWINDSKGTNLGALMASLAGLDAPVILLAGGQAKGADFAALGPIAAAKTRAVIVFGADAFRIASALAGHAPVVSVATLRDAVARAAALAAPGDTVLLSPGCASFDQFSGFAQRGECFVRAVAELAA